MAKRKQEKDSIGSETSSLKKQKLHLNVNQAKPNLSKDLVNAAYKGDAKLIESLLIAKADVNHERRGDYTELSIYLEKSGQDRVTHLLTKKANAHYIGLDGSTALILAAWTVNIKIF